MNQRPAGIQPTLVTAVIAPLERETIYRVGCGLVSVILGYDCAHIDRVS